MIYIILKWIFVTMSGKRIVLTADRSLMTNYRGNFLYGFIACGPYEVLPEWVFDRVFCPAVETDPITGEAKVAQVGLRRIESALLQGYKKDEIMIANPDFLEKSIGVDTKIVGINVMDPLGMAPVTTTMSPEKLSYVAMKFKRMCAKIIQLKKKYNFHVVVGGNGAWELAKTDRMKVHGIDTVVVGEADELALDLFNDIEKGDAPELMHCFVKNIQNIPVIEGPTVNSLIESMRGCGRGCDFCDVNKRDDEIKEIEDIYKAKGFTGKDLEMIVSKITSDKKVWLDTMLNEELNLNLDIVGHPIKSALRMFGSFLLGGMLPIIPFFFGTGLSPLFMAIGISITTSFAVGAVKSRMANTSIIKGGIEMAGLGTGIALIGFGIGSELANLGIINV